MSRESVLLVLAVLVILSPFLGVPYSWLMVLLPILGVLILGIAITLRARRSFERKEPEHTENHEAARV